MSSENTLSRLQEWYVSRTNGDWEHTYGITIANIDNPGWSLRVDLADTELLEVKFTELKVQRESEDDWIHCRVKEGAFQGFGGPSNLQELITVFLDWSVAAVSQRPSP